MEELGVPREFTATGDIDTAGVVVAFKGVSLTGGSDAATATLKEGGSGGTTRLVIKAAANVTVVVPIPFGIRAPHLTLAGTGPSFTAYM